MPPQRPYRQELGRAPGQLRIAFADTAPTGVALDPSCTAAVQDAARLCEQLGHHVTCATPDYDAHALERGFEMVFAANAMANIARVTGGDMSGPDLVEPLTYALAERGRSIPAAQYILNLHGLHRQSRRIAAFFETYDIWLTPTLAQTPRHITYFDIRSTDVDQWMCALGAYLPFTYPFNITGQPAASVPLYWDAQGLPIGCQFAARYGHEDQLLQLCAKLEQARPWFDRRPPLSPP